MHKPITMLLVLASLVAIPSVASAQAKEGNLQVLDVQFEPVGQGKNVVHVKMRNATEDEQTAAVHIQTKSPDFGGLGWGKPSFDTLAGRQTKVMRLVFKVYGPITDATWIRLRFYNPQSVETYDFNKHFQETRYTGPELKRRAAVAAKPVSQAKAEQIKQAFGQIQAFVKSRSFDKAWECFTNDYQQTEFHEKIQNFTNAMNGVRPWAAFVWDPGEFLELQAKSVGQGDGVLVLTAERDGQTWTVDFVEDAGRWKIDSIVGYVPPAVLWRNWPQRLLPKMQKHRTEHFDVYYFKHSTAERDIGKIAEARERAYQSICEFVGERIAGRIRLILFEDKKTKWQETGHQGMGWAFGNTMVEVCGPEGRLDPYHETTHVLMRGFGNPPAMFNEGFAVYTSERLGAPPLKNLGGGDTSLYARVKQLKTNGEWIPLEELLTYTEIGSKQTRPPVSYAEAGAFVKFLIDQYGKEKFLQAYKAMRNSDETAARQRNRKMVEETYGQSVRQLEAQWLIAVEASRR